MAKKNRCHGTTKKETRCTRNIASGNRRYCSQHSSKPKRVRRTKKGRHSRMRWRQRKNRRRMQRNFMRRNPAVLPKKGIYLLLHCVDYEGCSVFGVYSTLEKALLGYSRARDEEIYELSIRKYPIDSFFHDYDIDGYYEEIDPYDYPR